MKYIKIIFSLILALVLSVFAFQNSQIVDVNLWPLPFEFRITLSIVILGSLFVGILIGSFLVWAKYSFKKLFSKSSSKKGVSEIDVQ